MGLATIDPHGQKEHTEIDRYPVISYPWSFRTQTFRPQAETFRTHFRSVRTQPSGRFVPKKIFTRNVLKQT